MNKIFKMNKKGGGAWNIIIFIFILFIILFIGMALAFGGVIIDWVFDEAVPELVTIGAIGNSNVSEYTSMAIAPVNSFVQSFTWLSGVIYALALLGILGLAFAFRFTGNKWLMALFLGGIFLLIIASIFMSNIYEEFYTGTDEMATRLHEYELLSYLVLYSPAVMCVLGFVGAIIMFTGNPEESAGL